MFTIDNQSGTGENPVVFDLTENKTALVIVVKSNSEATQLESQKDDIISMAAESLELSGVEVSDNKYCYVFDKNEVDGKEFVECDLRVSTSQTDEEGIESSVLSETQGTYIVPSRVEFNDKSNVVVVVIFCNEDNINSNFLRASQAQVCGFIENNGDSDSLRFACALTPVDGSSKVLLRVQRGVFVDD